MRLWSINIDNIVEADTFQPLGRGESEMTTEVRVGSLRRFKRGAEIFNQGEIGESLICLVSGHVKIIKNDVEIAKRGPGELVGEMSLLEDEPRSATVIAETDCELLEYGRSEFAEAVKETPDLALKVMRSLSQKLRESDLLRLEELEEKNLSLTIKNKELSLVNRFLEQLVQQSPAGILLIDEHGRTHRCNPSAARVFGISEDAMGQSVLDRFIDGNPLGNLWRSSGEHWVGEASILVNDELRHLLLSISRLQADDAGRRYLLISEDISEIKRLNDQILKLERVTTADGVASEIAHDIKNYLASLLGYFEMLSNDFDEKFVQKHERYVNILLQTFNELRDYVENLMARKLQADTFVDSDLREVIGITFKFVSPQPRFRGINLKSRVDPEFPETVRVDEAQLQRVLLNLLVNAADALTQVEDDRCKQVTVELHHDAPGQRAILIISDNGCGMPPEVLADLFKKPTTTKANGHGIGLMTVKKIIETHSGTIRVESRAGRGTKFTITLPTEEG